MRALKFTVFPEYPEIWSESDVVYNEEWLRVDSQQILILIQRESKFEAAVVISALERDEGSAKTHVSVVMRASLLRHEISRFMPSFL